MTSPACQAGDEPPQLPDSDATARGDQPVATKLAKCGNVIAFDLGREILDEMQEMNEKFDRGMQRINDGMQRMSKKIDGLTIRFENLEVTTNLQLKAMNVNNAARLINRSLWWHERELSPLHNVATNEPIDGFPATQMAIKDMPGTALDVVLRALGIEINGELEQRRQRLTLQLGLQVNAV